MLYSISTILDPRMKQYAFVNLHNFQNFAGVIKDELKQAIARSTVVARESFATSLASATPTTSNSPKKVEKGKIVLFHYGPYLHYNFLLFSHFHILGGYTKQSDVNAYTFNPQFITSHRPL